MEGVMVGRKHVVIIGGGFGGLWAAQTLRKVNVQVTLIDRQNHHLFQPLLYQVATAGLSPADVAEPIRRVLRRAKNVDIRLAEVGRIDVTAKQVHLQNGDAIPYDWLILAAGSRHSYFGHDEWEVHAPGLKTIGDALEVRHRILMAFEKAEWAHDPNERKRLLTFVIVGAGPTGVEMAGAIAEIAVETLRKEFRHIDTRDTRVLLVEAGKEVLPQMAESLRPKALKHLESLGVEVRFGQPVTQIDEDGVVIGQERVRAETVLWAAGVASSPLAKDLGAKLDRVGRVHVEPDCSIAGHPEVFVVGDLMNFQHGGLEKPLPGVAQTAMQSGTHAAKCIRWDLDGKPRKPFKYWDKGTLATIGRKLAVADLGFLRLGGFLAWLIWVFVHILFLIGFRNRAVVMTKWAIAWFDFDRGSRLIWRADPEGAVPTPPPRRPSQQPAPERAVVAPPPPR